MLSFHYNLDIECPFHKVPYEDLISWGYFQMMEHFGHLAK